ncbi:MAG: ABC transporter transmembrane domain-containing protein [Hyphomicrobium sp.]
MEVQEKASSSLHNIPSSEREVEDKIFTSNDNLKSSKKSLKLIRPLLALKPYLLKNTKMLVWGAIALVISAGSMLSVPLAVRRIIDHGFSAGNSNFIGQYFVIMIVIGGILAVSIAARFFCVNWLGERVVADLRSEVFAHLTKLGPAFFERTQSGELISRLTADTTQIKAVAGHTLSQALRNALMLLGGFVMMFITSPHLSALTLISIPVIVLPLMAYGQAVKKLSRRAQDTIAEASAYAAENLAAVRTMISFAHEKVVASRFNAAVELSFDAARERMKARAGLTALTIFLTIGSVVCVLWYGASTVISGKMTAGELSQFIIYALFVAGAMGELAEVWGEITQASGAAERLIEILAINPLICSPSKPVSFPKERKGNILFNNVSFAYPTRPNDIILKDFSLSISAGETIALVGPSGAGKTTIFNLLLRFYDATSGTILVDGINIADARLEDLRRLISLVPQDVAIFADSVLENIRYGSPKASFEEVKNASIAAQADAFVQALPKGYETQLGERGVSLSGGQRQRIAIARAILKDSPILLLDEATSSLDAESERAVQKALQIVMKNRTTLVIAHRLATVQKVNRILVMKEGRVIESGTHSELVEKGGLYGRLADLQFGREAAE